MGLEMAAKRKANLTGLVFAKDSRLGPSRLSRAKFARLDVRPTVARSLTSRSANITMTAIIIIAAIIGANGRK